MTYHRKGSGSIYKGDLLCLLAAGCSPGGQCRGEDEKDGCKGRSQNQRGGVARQKSEVSGEVMLIPRLTTCGKEGVKSSNG